MGWLRASGLAAGIGLTGACGSAPAPPTAVEDAPGAGSAGGASQEILPNQPVSDDPPPERDAGSVADPGDTGEPPEPPVRPAEAGAPAPQAVAYYACTESQLVGCDYIHVTARDFEADICFQLTLDNCDDSGGRTLAVDTPLGWRLASGSALSGANACVAGEFDLKSAPATAASGEISWDVEARPPANLVIDVTLQLAPVPETVLPGRAVLTSGELGEPLPPCAD